MKSAEGFHNGLYWRTLGEREPVLVLHGGPGADHGYLLPQFEALASQFRLIFYDQRGSGRSRTGNPRPTIADHLADLDAIAQAFELDRMRLVGYSWGAFLGLRYTLEHPARVAKLALCSPMPPVYTYREPFLRAMEERAKRPEAQSLTGFAHAVSGYFADPRRALELTPFRVQASAEQSTRKSLGAYDLRPRLTELSLPVLVLVGDDDPIAPSYAEETARLIPGAKLVVLPDCGHVPYIECAESFFSELLRFLAH